MMGCICVRSFITLGISFTKLAHFIGLYHNVWPGAYFNPRRACEARVTVVGSVCLLLSVSLLECSFVSQRIRRA